MSVIASLKDLIKSASNIHSQGDKPNILLVATPRGGSTWVMEIISSQPGMKFYDEPFSIRRDNVRKTGLFKNWNDFQPEQAQDDKIIQYLNDLQTNKYKVMNPPPFRKNHRFLTNRIVFKIHELEHLVTTIEHECGMKVLYLLRHPIPNSLSRAVTPRLDLFMKSDVYKEQYLDKDQLDGITAIHQKGDGLELKVLDWCFENLVPLRFLDRSNWLTITYEELLLNSRNMCSLLSHKLQLDDLPALLKSVNEPAANITMSGQETLDILQNPAEDKRKLQMVKKWEGKITPEKEEEVMNILKLFGLDVYTTDRYIAAKPYLHFDDTESKMVDAID